MVRKAILSAAIAAVFSTGAYAAVYTYTGTRAGGDWTDPTKWQDENGDPGYPKAGDTALLHVAVESWTYLTVGSGGAAVGNLSARPKWSQLYRIRTTSGNKPTFLFDNNGNDSVVTLTSASNNASYTAGLVLGADNNAMNVGLANNLVVNNDGTRLPSGKLTFGTRSTITGGSLENRVTITTQALGTGKITTAVEGTATFIGDWVVDGANALLDMNADSFGHESNSVTLRNGGTLDITAGAFDSSGFSWNRTLSGNGTVLVHANGLVIDSGTINLSGDDQIVFRGDLILGPNSVLNYTGTFTGENMTLISANSITGTFGTVNAPGYQVAYTPDGVMLVVPEPGSVALLLGSAGMFLVSRRRSSSRQ